MNITLSRARAPFPRSGFVHVGDSRRHGLERQEPMFSLIVAISEERNPEGGFFAGI
jgi:hypothetical protein